MIKRVMGKFPSSPPGNAGEFSVSTRANRIRRITVVPFAFCFAGKIDKLNQIVPVLFEAIPPTYR
jgi:hypothetical protein